ncbi:hypothetical protein E2C01_094967 [Portunus trituberculatus]|uniref:Uncharacterized protein n=1 Tax=Portunus trituberculatus TaxID=210409 RepID=A0A5B7JYZ5_PORTR|nr:hypothetical protein [Portunus trituberculatus]
MRVDTTPASPVHDLWAVVGVRQLAMGTRYTGNERGCTFRPPTGTPRSEGDHRHVMVHDGT